MGRKQNKPSDNLAYGIFMIMHEFKSYRLEHIFSDIFTVPQYLELIDMLVEHYKEQEKQMNTKTSNKKRRTF